MGRIKIISVSGARCAAARRLLRKVDVKEGLVDRGGGPWIEDVNKISE